MTAYDILKRFHQRNDLFMEDVVCRNRLELPAIYKDFGTYRCFDTRAFHWAIFTPSKKMTGLEICNLHRWFEMHKIAMVFDATTMEHDVPPQRWKLMSMHGFDYVKGENEICCAQLAEKISAVLI